MTKPIEPDTLLAYLGEDAVQRLATYFDPNGGFTGAHFELFNGGGVAHRFTPSDIVAVSMLSVRIPGAASLEILDRQATHLNGLLAEIPSTKTIFDADETDLDDDSPAAHLWAALEAIRGMGWVSAGKLLARKRPHLIPVYDRVVAGALDRSSGDGWWLPLHHVLKSDSRIRGCLEGLRDRSEIDPNVSLLRVLDVAIWMSDRDGPEPIPQDDE